MSAEITQPFPGHSVVLIRNEDLGNHPPPSPFNLTPFLTFSFWCGEANRSGGDSPGKDGLLRTDAGYAGPHREVPGLVRGLGEGEENCGQAPLLWF